MKYFLVILCLGAAAFWFLRAPSSSVQRADEEPAPPPAAVAPSTPKVEETTVRMSYKKLLTPAYTALIESNEKVDYLRERNISVRELWKMLDSAPNSPDRAVAYRLCAQIDKAVENARSIQPAGTPKPTAMSTSSAGGTFKNEHDRAAAEKAARESFFKPAVDNSEWTKKIGVIQTSVKLDWVQLSDVSSFSGPALLAYLREQALRQPNPVVARLQAVVLQRREGGAMVQLTQQAADGIGPVTAAQPIQPPHIAFVEGLAHIPEKGGAWLRMVHDGNYSYVDTTNRPQSVERWVYLEEVPPAK